MTLADDRTAPAGQGEVPSRPYGAIWWLPLLLIVATDYKFRRRLNEDTLSGRADVFVLLEIAVYGLVAAYLAFQPTPRYRSHPVIVFTTGYCLAAAVSAIYAPFPIAAAVRAFQLLVILAVYISWTSTMDLTMVRRFLHGFVVLVTVSIGIGLVYVAPTSVRQIGRFTWLYTHSVVAASIIAVSCVILFGMWLTHRTAALPWARWVYGVLFVVNFVSLIRTETRGSIGAALIAMMVMVFLWSRGRARRDLIVILPIVLIALAVSTERLLVGFALRGDPAEKLTTFNRRTEIWALAWEAFLRHPLQGLGLTASRGVFYTETGLGGAHNAYVNVAIDVGLVGLFFWLGLIIALVRALSRIRSIRKSMGQPPSFDEVTIIGIMVTLGVNGITTEGVGAGVSTLSLMLFLTGAWVIALGDAQHRILPPISAASQMAHPGDSA